MKNYAKELLVFIDNSPTAFHAVKTIEDELLSSNFIQLLENKSWEIEANKKYYVKRDDASIITFITPKKITENSLFKIIGAHTDSPCLKIKSNPTSTREGYQMLNCEIYGGVLLNSWFDRDLNFGGRVFIEDENGNLRMELVKFDFKIRIPRLAIHMDRGVNNEGFKPNPQDQMFPTIGLGENVNFEKLIQQRLQTKDNVLSWDIFLFDTEKSSFGGMKEEFIYAPRLDNLSSVHASLTALKESSVHDTDIIMTSFFHHEEVGSQSQNGAGSNFQEATLKRINSALNRTDMELYATLSKSFFISADMAHATHPNYSNLHDPNHKPSMNKGPVIKSNGNERYASNAYSIAKFKQWCNNAKVPFQNFNIRNDMGCGSTIGPMTASKLGIPTIDIGNPMLSMHSIREMCGTADHEMIIKVFKEFFR